MIETKTTVKVKAICDVRLCDTEGNGPIRTTVDLGGDEDVRAWLKSRGWHLGDFDVCSYCFAQIMERRKDKGEEAGA